MVDYEGDNGFRLEAGQGLPAVQYTLDRSTVDAYLNAVEESSRIYHETDLVPPTAIAALAMAALAEGTEFPPGSIHVSQKLDFKHSVHIGDTIFCHSRIGRSYKRAGMHLITVELRVENAETREVLTGELSFIAPQENRIEGK
jgi:hypothetical protein